MLVAQIDAELKGVVTRPRSDVTAMDSDEELPF